MSVSRSKLLSAAGFVLAAALLTGCSGDSGDDAAKASQQTHQEAPAPAPSTTPLQEGEHYVAVAAKPVVSVHEAPNGAVTTTFANPQQSGAPLNFLVKEHDDGWLNVYLPARPNGATGWIPANAVQVQELPYRLEVSTATNELTLFEGETPVQTFAVATGTGGTPTPLGTFYLTELLAPTNDGYGPYAYGLSAFSEVLNYFGGGPGQIGLHGTDDEGTIGQAVSHGCIRMSNADITMLAEMLPLGTPITIT